MKTTLSKLYKNTSMPKFYSITCYLWWKKDDEKRNTEGK